MGVGGETSTGLAEMQKMVGSTWGPPTRSGAGKGGQEGLFYFGYVG